MSRGWYVFCLPSHVNFDSPPRNMEPEPIPVSRLYLLSVLSQPKGLEGFLPPTPGAPFTLGPVPLPPTPPLGPPHHQAELSPQRGS